MQAPVGSQRSAVAHKAAPGRLSTPPSHGYPAGGNLARTQDSGSRCAVVHAAAVSVHQGGGEDNARQ